MLVNVPVVVHCCSGKRDGLYSGVELYSRVGSPGAVDTVCAPTKGKTKPIYMSGFQDTCQHVSPHHGGLRLRIGSGVGSYSEVGQGWTQTQKWVRGGLRLRSGSGVGSNSEVGRVDSNSEVGQGWTQTQKWVRGGLRLRSGSGVGSDSVHLCTCPNLPMLIPSLCYWDIYI